MSALISILVVLAFTDWGVLAYGLTGLLSSDLDAPPLPEPIHQPDQLRRVAEAKKVARAQPKLDHRGADVRQLTSDPRPRAS